MGGDNGLPVTIPASIKFLKEFSDTKLLLVGDSVAIQKSIMCQSNVPNKRFEIVHAPETIEMDDSIEIALRKKKYSSMRFAVQAVRSREADACISAGNTGAWMAISRYILKTLKGIDRPAIAATIPNQTNRTTIVLDLGANVDCTEDHIFQFAVMGSALCQTMEHNDDPSIGLLNIGEELIKGNEVVKKAAGILRSSSLNFYGNVEGNDIFKGTVDVVVCDGFVGNAVLKSIEGLANMIKTAIRKEFTKNLTSLLIGTVAKPIIDRLRYRMDNRRYNGASLLGLRGIVIKSHGAADIYAFDFALRRAREAVINRLLERIAETVSRITCNRDRK